MAHKIQQITTRTHSIEWLCKSKHFARGIFDAALGEPFDKSYDLWTTEQQWNYERGRIFAIAYPQVELFSGTGKSQHITYAARQAFADALRTGIML